MISSRALPRTGHTFALALLAAPLFLPGLASAQGFRLNAPLQPLGDVLDFQVSPDRSRVVYHADQETDDVVELYSVTTDGRTSPVKLSGPLVLGRIISRFLISPDGSRVVYRADQEQDELFELYSVPIDASASPVKLNGPVVDLGAIFDDFQVSSDSSRVVYRGDQDTNDVVELYSAPIDGSAEPVRLNATLASGGAVLDFQISPDSTLVLYEADQDTNDLLELYSVPVDSSASPVNLSGPLAPGGGVLGFQISPDSTRAVFRAHQDLSGVFELFSAPIDGSAGPVELSGTLVAGGDVTGSYRISPDSGRVVYRSDQEQDEVFELFSAPIDGGVQAVRLNGPLFPGSAVSPAFLISPDSNRVVYRADQDQYAVIELYSVPIDAGASPVRLNGTIVTGGSVLSGFQITPDGDRVLYPADQDQNDVFELYSAPILGGSTPVKLNDSLATGGDVHDFLVAPEGSVVYRADQATDGADELFRGSGDGVGEPLRLNRTLPAGGDVLTDFQLGRGVVVYRADQDQDQVFQLYLSFLILPHQRAPVPTHTVIR